MTNEQKNNNIAKIFYRKTVDGPIQITRFENILTQTELKEKFGDEVYRIYFAQAPYFYKSNDSHCTYCSQGDSVSIGKIFTEQYFQQRIEFMKRCGKRLGEIRRKVAEEEFTKERSIKI